MCPLRSQYKPPKSPQSRTMTTIPQYHSHSRNFPHFHFDVTPSGSSQLPSFASVFGEMTGFDR
jgi:hypothetical protein